LKVGKGTGANYWKYSAMNKNWTLGNVKKGELKQVFENMF